MPIRRRPIKSVLERGGKTWKIIGLTTHMSYSSRPVTFGLTSSTLPIRAAGDISRTSLTCGWPPCTAVFNETLGKKAGTCCPLRIAVIAVFCYSFHTKLPSSPDQAAALSSIHANLFSSSGCLQLVVSCSSMASSVVFYLTVQKLSLHVFITLLKKGRRWNLRQNIQ